jgi:hypothetical protein
MASNDKTFYFYFKENMNATPFIVCPETLFGQFSTAVVSITAMASYVKTYGSSATVRQMIGTVGGASVFAGGGAIGAAEVIAEIGVVVVELSAAYYVGACIGSLFVAAAKSGADLYARAAINSTMNKLVLYTVHDVSNFAQRHKIEMAYEVQKILHKSPQLYQCH